MSAAVRGPSQLMDELAAAISIHDATILAVHQLYGATKSLSFFIGVDSNEMPPVSNAPYIAMMPGDYSRASRDEYKNIGAKMALVIAQSAIDTSIPKITKMKGFSDLEIVMHPIQDCVKDYFISKFGRFLSWGTIQTDVFFPEFRATWSVDAKDEIT